VKSSWKVSLGFWAFVRPFCDSLDLLATWHWTRHEIAVKKQVGFVSFRFESTFC